MSDDIIDRGNSNHLIAVFVGGLVIVLGILALILWRVGS